MLLPGAAGPTRNDSLPRWESRRTESWVKSYGIG
jgi:hypothetical protein